MLARLSNAQARPVLDAIERGEKPALVRKILRDADADRKAKSRAKPSRKPVRSLSARIADKRVDYFAPSLRGVRRERYYRYSIQLADMMSPTERAEAVSASRDEWVGYARDVSRMRPPPPSMQSIAAEVNPFWYHSG